MHNVLHLQRDHIFFNSQTFVMPNQFREFLYVTSYLAQLTNFFDLSASLPKSRYSAYSTRIPSRVSQLVLHHTGTSTMSVYDINSMHIKEKDWPGIGYHILIQQDGSILLCNKLHIQSYHCKDNNFKSIGIAINHNCEVEAPSPKALAALRDVLFVFAYHFHSLSVYGHKELGSTLCPGRFFPLDEMKDFYSHCRAELSLVNSLN